MSSAKVPDFVDRGVKRPSPGNRAIYVVLRMAVPFITYVLLASPTIPNLLASFNLRTIAVSTPLYDVGHVFPNFVSTLQSPAIRLAALGLSVPRALLLAGSIAAAAKQIYWGLVLQQETLSLSNAVYVPLVNFVPEVLQALLYFARASSTTTRHGEGVTGPIAVGSVSFALGIVVEWLSEVQRKRFKDDPRNTGKLYRGGLFALARHVNFAGFIAWKSAGPLMAGGYGVGGVTLAAFTVFFTRTAIPPLDAYCQRRYREQWTRYKKDVPRRLVPGL